MSKPESLEANLRRLEAALTRGSGGGASTGTLGEWKPGELQKGAAVGLIGTGVVLAGLAVGTLTLPLLAPAVLCGLAGWGFVSKSVHDWVVNSLPGAVGPVDASKPRIGMGASVSDGARSLPAQATPAPEQDARLARIDSACDRLDAELADATPNIKGLLGVNEKTVGTLRASCRALHARERVLRIEATGEKVQQLESERRALAAKRDAAADEAVRRSLDGALKAIDAHREQRAVLQRNADRFDAELTRLILTIEGTTAQLLRLKAAGMVAGPDAGGVQRLNEEVAAVVQAVEEISSEPAGAAWAQRERY